MSSRDVSQITPPLSPNAATSLNVAAPTNQSVVDRQQVSSDAGATFTVAPSPVARLPFSVEGVFLSEKVRSATYSFRSHPTVEWALKMFASVEIDEVTIAISQCSVAAATSSAKTVMRLRFGIAPRGIATANGTTGVVDRIPHLKLITSSFMVPAQVTTTWARNPAQGQFSFPPGIQTDLKPLETRFNYAEVFLGHNNPQADGADIWAVQIDGFVSCSGIGFGAPF